VLVKLFYLSDLHVLIIKLKMKINDSRKFSNISVICGTLTNEAQPYSFDSCCL